MANKPTDYVPLLCYVPEFLAAELEHVRRMLIDVEAAGGESGPDDAAAAILVDALEAVRDGRLRGQSLTDAARCAFLRPPPVAPRSSESLPRREPPPL